MAKKSSQKLVFIDSSAFIDCVVEEIEGLEFDILRKIKQKMNDNEIILLLPETVKVETKTSLLNVFKKFELVIKSRLILKNDNGEKGKKSKLLSTTIDEVGKEALKKFKKECKKRSKIIDEIFNHKNTENIKLTDKIIVTGMKRALLMKPPYNKLNSKKGSYAKDQDCIIFELLVNHLAKNKKMKKMDCIFCIDDSDYFKNIKKGKLHQEIIEDIKDKCKSLSAYWNPLKMLDEEFDEEYTDDQVKEYEQELLSREFVPYELVESEVPRLANENYGVIARARLADVNDSFVLASAHSNSLIGRDKVKFCPHCGKNIESEIDSIESRYRFPTLSQFQCPFCLNIIKN